MRRVKVSLPATLTDLGPGLAGLGIALGLHMTIEIAERSDDRWVVETHGEDAGRYAVGLRHPVVLGLIRAFQHLETTVLGLTIRIENHIPHAAGLGVEAAYMTAGISAANNLLGNPLDRAAMLKLAAVETRRPDQVTAAVLGGLVCAVLHGDQLIYRSLPCAPFQLAIVAPDADEFADLTRGMFAERVPIDDVLHALGHLPLLLEALRAADLDLLNQAAFERFFSPQIRLLLPGLEDAMTEGRRAGAAALLLTRGGALIAFADKGQPRIAEAMRSALEAAGTSARAWTLPIDRQGIVVSVAQSA